MKPKCYPVLQYCRRLVARTLPFQGGEAGSIPVDSSSFHGGLAHLGEHLLCKQRVVGSSPTSSTKLLWLLSSAR